MIDYSSPSPQKAAADVLNLLLAHSLVHSSSLVLFPFANPAPNRSLVLFADLHHQFDLDYYRGVARSHDLFTSDLLQINVRLVQSCGVCFRTLVSQMVD